MPTLEIDGQSVTVEEGVNLIQAAERVGIEIPHYCYHPCLSVAGSCRMCLIEVEKMPKLQIACNTRATEGMVVRTQSEQVKRARAAVLEFLLLNHPVDCPICDQAGECKLQDYYMDYDRQASRFPLEAKVRKGKAIDIGPLIMLDQERCILCTRCIRFLDEVTKTSELGVFERGNHCQIELFPGKRLDNPYSGNVADICPVGALTNKDFRFRARVWYLERTSSVCPTCATGCNIDIHHRGGEVFRFRPRHNEAVNGYWMCDEGRLSYKNLRGEGRLLQPVVRDGTGWAAQTWEESRSNVVKRLRGLAAEHGGGAVAGVVSAQATNEEVFLFSRLVGNALQGQVAGFAWSPSDAYRDDFLVDADKNPNSAGLRACGVSVEDTDELVSAVERGQVRGLVALRADLGAGQGEQFLTTLAARLEFLVVLDTHFSATAKLAHVLLPVATFAETDGTFVNRSRRVQRIRAAFAPPAQVQPGWLVLGQLLAEAGAGAVPIDAGAVFNEIAASSPAFRSLSYETIGELGSPLDEAVGLHDFGTTRS